MPVRSPPSRSIANQPLSPPSSRDCPAAFHPPNFGAPLGFLPNLYCFFVTSSLSCLPYPSVFLFFLLSSKGSAPVVYLSLWTAHGQRAAHTKCQKIVGQRETQNAKQIRNNISKHIGTDALHLHTPLFFFFHRHLWHPFSLFFVLSVTVGFIPSRTK